MSRNFQFIDNDSTAAFELPSEPYLSEEEIRHAASEDAFDINILQSLGGDAMEVDVDTSDTTDLFAAMTAVRNPATSTAPPLKQNCILANQSNFEKVVNVISSKLQESVSMKMSFAYFPDEQIFRVKFLSGSNSRELDIKIVYDSLRRDHIVQIQRVSGDGLFYYKVDLFSLLQSTFDPSVTKKTSSTAALVPSMEFLSALPALSKVDFESGFLSLLQMAQNNYVESRLEAVKMFCEVFNQPTNIQLLVAAENHESLFFPCLRVILSLLQNTAATHHREIFEFATIAVCTLIDKLVSLRLFDALKVMLEFAKGDLPSLLLTQILGDDSIMNMKKEEKYWHVLRRRNVAQSLALISQSFSALIIDNLRKLPSCVITNRMELTRRMEEKVEDKYEEIFMLKVCDNCFPR